jgi:SNF2 family DNA or RNA helicase
VSVLLKFEFERIILDEAHTVRNPNAAISLAVSRIRARKRWAVTGTPVQNNQSDFYSLLRFIGFSPLNDLSVCIHIVSIVPIIYKSRDKS